MRSVTLSLVQMNSRIDSPERNLERMRGFVSRCEGSDIICFPEMCLSGYTTKGPDRIAMDPSDPLISEIHSLASEKDVAIIFGYVERTENGLMLRQEIADGSGVPKFYRKTHLGSTEAKVFIPGNELPVFDVKGIRLGIQLCIESHIQEVCSTLRSKGAELVLTPFSTGITGDRRRDVWRSYLPSRASDNGMFVAACSAVGDNGEGTVFGGGLIAYDPKGNVIDEYYGTEEKVMTISIGGKLPRDGPETMSNISYYDRRRPELYR